MKRLVRTTAVLLTAAAAMLGGVAGATAYEPEPEQATVGKETERGVAPQADAYPCGNPWYHSGVGLYVQTCPDWAPANSQYGAYRYPVFATPWDRTVVGTIYAPGADWFVCDAKFVDAPYHAHGYANDWWAFTMADNGEWGWVPEVYFKGGNNWEPDSRLALCF
jgi:hypothetical protein